MKSMTGYAKVSCTLGNRKLNIEIKTLNSKQLDLIVKVPAALRAHELEIRTALARLERGKVECIVSDETSATQATFNSSLLQQRVDAVSSLYGEESRQWVLGHLASMTDIWNTASESELSEAEWQLFADALNQAIDATDAFRAHEGSILEKDFHLHVDLIEQKLAEIPQYEAERIDTARERIRRMMADNEVRDVDENRFEQEIIYYLEKLDITEEKVRLQKHIDYFRQTMATEATCGKKLGFVAQEMGREINTTGSKANHVEIQRLVVVMKDELEKIKEQLGNVL